MDVGERPEGLRSLIWRSLGLAGFLFFVIGATLHLTTQVALENDAATHRVSVEVLARAAAEFATPALANQSLSLREQRQVLAQLKALDPAVRSFKWYRPEQVRNQRGSQDIARYALGGGRTVSHALHLNGVPTHQGFAPIRTHDQTLGVAMVTAQWPLRTLGVLRVEQAQLTGYLIAAMSALVSGLTMLMVSRKHPDSRPVARTEPETARVEAVTTAAVDEALAARSSFLASFVLEVMEPLSGAAQLSHHLLTQTTDPFVQAQVGKVCEHTERIRDLVSEAQKLSRLEAGELDFQRLPVYLDTFLKSVVDGYTASHHPGRPTEIELHHGAAPPALLPANRLREIIESMLLNAHASESRRVKLTTGATRQGSVSWLTIEVRADSGPWYDPGVSTTRIVPSTALSAIKTMLAKRNAQMMGGTLVQLADSATIRQVLRIPMPSAHLSHTA